MKSKRRLKRLLIVLIIVSIFSIAFLYLIKNYVYNASNSFPIGLYKKINKDVARSDFVLFCPELTVFMVFAKKNGYWKGFQNKCGDTPEYLKKVVGVPGDNISVTYSGVYINKEKIINSEPLKRILSDEIFINYEKDFKLKKDEYFLMSDYNPMSYDSRYFGVIKKIDINTVVVPFYNFK